MAGIVLSGTHLSKEVPQAVSVIGKYGLLQLVHVTGLACLHVHRKYAVQQSCERAVICGHKAYLQGRCLLMKRIYRAFVHQTYKTEKDEGRKNWLAVGHGQDKSRGLRRKNSHSKAHSDAQGPTWDHHLP